MKTSLVAAIALALPIVSAHFTLDYPKTRGFSHDIENRTSHLWLSSQTTGSYRAGERADTGRFAEFCGGFPNPLLPRQQYPLGSAPLIINSGHTAQIGIQISFDQNPASFANFNATSTGTPISMLEGFALADGRGIVSLPALPLLFRY